LPNFTDVVQLRGTRGGGRAGFHIARAVGLRDRRDGCALCRSPASAELSTHVWSDRPLVKFALKRLIMRYNLPKSSQISVSNSSKFDCFEHL
jgi:hypothetical protein